VTTDRLIKEAAEWGLSRRRAEAAVALLLDAAPHALQAARDETPDVPEEVVEVVESQVARLRDSFPASANSR
jgi:hypothetical protein